MQNEHYPALFVAADRLSNKAQEDLLLSYKLNSALLLCASVTALASSVTPEIAILSAILFLSSLGMHALGQYQDLRGRWYQARALAESIKTASWRLMMHAEPFAKSNEQENLSSFRSLLSELLTENKGIGKHLDGDWSGQEQITNEMIKAMRSNFGERKSIYLARRIDEQRDWYAKKAKENQRASRKFFSWLCLAYGVAIVLLLYRIAEPSSAYLPIEVFAVLASTLIGWTQIKRFDELASAYGLTAHEVGIIKTRYGEVVAPEDLSRFVSDSENAFSREHTQWAARRDH